MKVIGLRWGEKVRITLEDGRQILVSVPRRLSRNRVQVGIEAERLIPIRPVNQREDEEPRP